MLVPRVFQGLSMFPLLGKAWAVVKPGPGVCVFQSQAPLETGLSFQVSEERAWVDGCWLFFCW